MAGTFFFLALSTSLLPLIPGTVKEGSINWGIKWLPGGHSQKLTSQPDHFYAHFWAFLHFLKVDSPDIGGKTWMRSRTHHDQFVTKCLCGVKNVPTSEGHHSLLHLCQNSSNWGLNWKHFGNHFMPQMVVPSFILPGLTYIWAVGYNLLCSVQFPSLSYMQMHDYKLSLFTCSGAGL